jgi:hypothetical protein
MSTNTGVVIAGNFTVTASGDSTQPATYTFVPDPLYPNQAQFNGNLDFTPWDTLAIAISVVSFTGGASPTIQVFVDYQDTQRPVSKKYHLMNFSAVSGPNDTLAAAGPATANNFNIGNLGDVSWTLTGAPTNVKFYISVIGKGQK